MVMIMYKDLFKSMRLGAILGLISNIIQDVSAVFIASVLGNFTSAVLNSDIKSMKSSIYKLLLAILITVVLIPVFQILSNKIILKNSFTHENILIDKYLKFDESIIRDIKSYKFDNIIEKEATMLRLNFIWAFQNVLEALMIILILIASLTELPIYYFIFIMIMGFIRFISFNLFKNEVSEYTSQKYQFKENERKILFACSFEKDWLKFNNLHTKFMDIYEGLFNGFFKDKVTIGEKYMGNQKAVRNLADGLFLILVVGFGMILCSKNIITIYSIIKVLAMSVVINKLFDCAKKSVDSFVQLKSLKINVEKFYSNFSEDKVSNNGNRKIEINAENLSYTVNGKNILKPVNFIIKKGDKVKISGENGSGKTTLIKILSNIYTDYVGNIKINGVELKCTKNFNVNYFCQDSYMFPINIRENIFLGRQKKDLNFVGKELFEKQHIKGISGGERHKINLDRVFVGNSDVFIFDEPLNHLDNETTEKFLKIFNDLDATVIFVDHKNIIKNYNKEIILSH